MKKFCFLIFSTFILFALNAQPPGYYNGTDGLKGEALKAQLHEIINNHVDFSYSQAKFIINYSDADPSNPNNVILFYTQRSQNADTYGTGGDFINREHVWAKSHGNFSGLRPMDGDAFNLRPADASVNSDRSNNDFGNVKPNGTQHPEATECWYTSQRWEPGDATKGQVARIILYMDTRYEGTNGEINLTAVNGFDTYPRPEHGDLATLLEWNRQFPPSDFERQRNERIFSIQQNRNPFIDNPGWADLIWAAAVENPIVIDQFSMAPKIPKSGETPVLSFSINAGIPLSEAVLSWGKTFNSEEEKVNLNKDAMTHSVPVNLSRFMADDMVYYKVVAKAGTTENTVHGTFRLPRNISAVHLTPISEVQGTTDISPKANQVVTIAGRVVANYDNAVYIQSGRTPYSGMCVYGSLLTGHVGDSIVVSGKVEEFNQLTEITNVSYFFNHKENKIIEPIVLKANQIGEQHEGMLVTIKDVTFDNAGATVPDANTSYPFRDETGSSVVFSRYGTRLTGKKIPFGVTDVTGVVSQYQNTYQILPRSIDDFSAGKDTIAPQVIRVSPIDKAWITVDFNERIEKISSESIENYNFSGSINVLSAFRYEEGTTVIINIEGLSLGTHTLTVSGVKDESGNEMGPVTVEFTSEYTTVDVFDQLGLKVYPNPLDQGFLNIESRKEIMFIEIKDLSGRTILKEQVNQNRVQLPLSGNPGFYLLTIHLFGQAHLNTRLLLK